MVLRDLEELGVDRAGADASVTLRPVRRVSYQIACVKLSDVGLRRPVDRHPRHGLERGGARHVDQGRAVRMRARRSSADRARSAWVRAGERDHVDARPAPCSRAASASTKWPKLPKPALLIRLPMVICRVRRSSTSCGDGLRQRQVERDHRRRRAVLLGQIDGQRLEPVLPPGDEHEVGAALGQRVREADAEAARGAGDQRGGSHGVEMCARHALRLVVGCAGDRATLHRPRLTLKHDECATRPAGQAHGAALLRWAPRGANRTPSSRAARASWRPATRTANIFSPTRPSDSSWCRATGGIAASIACCRKKTATARVLEHEIVNVAQIAHWAGAITGRSVVAGAPAAFGRLLTEIDAELGEDSDAE